MQDRFKFRGLSKGKWYYGAYFKHLPYTPYCCGGEPPEKDYKHLIIQEGFSDWGLPRSMTCIEVEKDTVGQCTGLKDKNGKLIYEGDIIKIPDDWGEYGMMAGEKREIFFNKSGFRLKPKLCKNVCGYWLEDTKDFEVIGNIYENKELLECEG